VTPTVLLLALSAVVRQAAQTPPDSTHRWPFGVGERFEYEAKLGVLKLGTGAISVVAIDTVRGIESFRLRYEVQGGVVVFHLNNVMQSWVGTGDLISRRFHQDFQENDRKYINHFEIYPDSGYFREDGRTKTFPTPPEPLDDAAFFFFIRTTPLVVGETYQYNRYFRQELNPVTLKVLKREDFEMPDGTKVPCLVLQPIVGSDGIFAPRADSRLWLTDDAHRIPVQIRSRLPYGTITLRLTGAHLSGAPPATPAGTR
jgi:hypothetical protein